ncbi:hypothetical protein ACLKA7_006467 [Drosophila subpalustris]
MAQNETKAMQITRKLPENFVFTCSGRMETTTDATFAKQIVNSSLKMINNFRKVVPATGKLETGNVKIVIAWHLVQAKRENTDQTRPDPTRPEQTRPRCDWPTHLKATLTKCQNVKKRDFAT